MRWYSGMVKKEERSGSPQGERQWDRPDPGSGRRQQVRPTCGLRVCSASSSHTCQFPGTDELLILTLKNGEKSSNILSNITHITQLEAPFELNPSCSEQNS